MHNRVQRIDDMRVEEQNDILSVFYSSARPFKKAKERLLTQSEKDVVKLYIYS